MKIYTTNYDSIIPQVLCDRKIYTAEQNRVVYTTYKADYKRNEQSHLCFFSLHGSIYWTKEIKDSRYRTIKSSIVKGVVSLNEDGGNPNEPLIFCPIIVGYMKTRRSLTDPFNIGFTNFAYDCNTCNKIITIGYSFSDPHINSVIRTNTDFNNVRLINVSFMKEFKGSDEYKRIDAFIRPICMPKEDDNNIWFYGSGNSIVVYKKGTQSFFSDRKNWGKI